MSDQILPPPKPPGSPSERLPAVPAVTDAERKEGGAVTTVRDGATRAAPADADADQASARVEVHVEVLPPRRPVSTIEVRWRGPFAASRPRAGAMSAKTVGSRILLAGGIDPRSGTTVDSIEVWDPLDGTWSEAGKLVRPRVDGVLVALHAGRVLVTGGRGADGVLLAPTEMWSLVDNTSIDAGAIARPRAAHAAGYCRQNKRVLLCGGVDAAGRTIADVESWTLDERTWKRDAPLRAARRDHTLTFLRNRTALAIGGHLANGEPTASCELWDVATPGWSDSSPLAVPRAAHQAIAIQNSALVWSGQSAELVDARSTITLSAWLGPDVEESFLLSDGRVLGIGPASDGARAMLCDPRRNDRAWLAPWPRALPAAPTGAWVLADGRIAVLCEPPDAPPCVLVTEDAAPLGSLPGHLTGLAFRASDNPDALAAELAAAVAEQLRQRPLDEVIGELRQLGHPLYDFDAQGSYCYDWDDPHLAGGANLLLSVVRGRGPGENAERAELGDLSYSRTKK